MIQTTRVVVLFALYLVTFLGSAKGYHIDKRTCGCELEKKVEDAIHSAWQFASEGWQMIDNAEANRVSNDQDQREKDEALNAAVRGLGKRLYGDEKNLWSKLGEIDSVKEKFLAIKANYRVRKRSEDPEIPKKVEDYDKPGWAKKLIADEIIFYCAFNNIKEHADRKPPAGNIGNTRRLWNHDLDEEIPDLLVKSFDECSGKTKPSGDGVTMAITYSEYVHEDFPTLASRATQIFLCPPYVKELSREKYMFSTEELLKKIDKFEGDPPEQSGRRLSRKEKLKGVFKKITSSRSEEPEIMEYQAVHRILLHELFHVPDHGKAIDVKTQPCYGWRNCAAMSANPEDAMVNADSHTMLGVALFWERNNVCVTPNGNLVARNEDAPHKCETEPPLDELRRQWDQKRAELAKDDREFIGGHTSVEDGDKITQIGFAKDVRSPGKA